MNFFQSGAVRTAYEITGDGPPLLLLHGAEADHRMFGPLVAELAPHAMIISYDQRDCGLTEYDGPDYSIADLADDAAALIDGLGLTKAHIVGQSLGSLIAQLLAVRHPERVDRLVLSAAIRAGTPLTEAEAAGLRKAAALRAEGEAGIAGVAALFTTASFVEGNPAFLDTWRGIAPTTSAAQRARRGRAPQQSVGSIDLSTITSPTLVIAGEADQIIPSTHTRGIAEVIPNARFELLAGIGHVSPLQAPETLAASLIRFLDL